MIEDTWIHGIARILIESPELGPTSIEAWHLLPSKIIIQQILNVPAFVYRIYNFEISREIIDLVSRRDDIIRAGKKILNLDC